jgi:hypothetical protein
MTMVDRALDHPNPPATANAGMNEYNVRTGKNDPTISPRAAAKAVISAAACPALR